MTQLTEKDIRNFIFAQSEAWNAVQKDVFLELYRKAAPNGVTLEYVGKATLTGDAALAGLNNMWDQYVHLVQQQPFEVIVNGADVACYYRNIWRAEERFSTGIETYSFRDGRVHIRMFH